MAVAISALLLSLCAAALVLRGTLADLLLSALSGFLDGGGSLVMSRRSTAALLAHAILLLVLRDAGVLSSPAARRRKRRDQPLVQADTNVVAARCAERVEVEGPEAAATKEIVLVDKWASTGDNDHIARVHRPAVAAQVAADEGDADDRAALLWPTTTRSRTEGEAEEEKEEEEEEEEEEGEESVDEMNRRFDKFIADMRRNMQLETLQLQQPGDDGRIDVDRIIELEQT